MLGIFSRSVRATAETLAERYNSASALHGSALKVFEDVAARLSDAEAEYHAVADDANAEIARLTLLRDSARADAGRANDSAVSLLDITRGFRND
jgi:F0F1-type ATP synthase membrane subunit b/b'